MFDTSHTQLVVFCHADGRLDRSILNWATQYRWHGVRTTTGTEDDVVRNLNVRDAIALPASVHSVVWIDADMAPYSRESVLQPWCDADADVVAAFYRTKNPASHATPGSFHMGLVRMRLKALRQLWEQATDESPLFEMRTTDKGCRLQRCVCESFRRHVLANGLTIVRAGYCVHNNPRLECG